MTRRDMPGTTMRAPELAASDTRSRPSRRDVGASATSGIYHTGEGRLADELCHGCLQPASDVGMLTSVRLVTHDGHASDARYCADCVTITRTAVAHPGEGYGAVALRSDLVSMEVGEPVVIADDELAVLIEHEQFNDRVLADAGVSSPAILGWVTYADPSMTLGEIVGITRQIESLGVRVSIVAHRNDRGVVDGFTLGRLVA